MQELFFGKENVSLSVRCPHFSGVPLHIYHYLMYLPFFLSRLPVFPDVFGDNNARVYDTTVEEFV